MVSSDEFDDLCDIVTTIALTSVPINRLPVLIEHIQELKQKAGPHASPKRIMIHKLIEHRIQMELNEAIKNIDNNETKG